MKSRPQRWDLWRHVIGVVVCLVVGWFGLVQGVRIPVMADASYGFHEFGHLMTWFLPGAYRAMMGSLFQMLIPLGLAGYFLLFQRDLLGVSLMLVWTAVSAGETSLYMGDAAARTIQISPYHLDHDWALALDALGRLNAADELSWIVQAAAIICVLAAIGVSSVGVMRAVFEYQEAEESHAFVRSTTAPRRSGYEEWVAQQQPATVRERRP